MDSNPEFFNVRPVQPTLDELLKIWQPARRHKHINTRLAYNHVLAKDVYAPISLPEFNRSAVDGYAVYAADTSGASPSLPAYLNRAGAVLMGQPAATGLLPNEAIEIHTGAMLPPGADAVVMLERTQMLSSTIIEVLAPAAPGENVIHAGEDIQEGALILPAGHRLRPQDIGGLLAAGILALEVSDAPRVGILSCGDELVPPEQTPAHGQIRDINAYTLAALVEQAGGQAVLLGIARDSLDDYTQRAQSAFYQVDILIMTAGSSISTRDLTRAVINQLGKPGILQHGLAVKPGKPTIIALCENKPVIGLPGNPVSALLVAQQILSPLIKHFLGEAALFPAVVRAVLNSNITSAAGREDYIPVRLIEQNGHLTAEPVFGKSNLIYTLVKADGLVHIPLNAGGIYAGSIVEVKPFHG